MELSRPTVLSIPSAFLLDLSIIQDDVEVGIDSLLRAREQDPYLDPPTRLLYERVKGEPAPTFPAPVLDAAVLRTRLAREGKRRRERNRGSATAGAGNGEGSTSPADDSPTEVATAVEAEAK